MKTIDRQIHAHGDASDGSKRVPPKLPGRMMMLYQMESPGLTARMSPGRRRASMRCFERIYTRVLMVGSAGIAIAMTTFICMTAHLLG